MSCGGVPMDWNPEEHAVHPDDDENPGSHRQMPPMHDVVWSGWHTGCPSSSMHMSRWQYAP